MSTTPTKTATAGVFQSHGEDFVQYIDSDGSMASRVDALGIQYGVDFVASSGISLTGLQAQIVSGLPSVIDEGTF